MNRSRQILVLLAVAVACVSPALAQKRVQKGKPAPKTPSVIFAVISDGRVVEPIAKVESGKLTAPASGSDDANVIAAFAKTYYKTDASYRLIFGGVDAGTVRVESFDQASDCGKNMANVVATSDKAKLKGRVMALATNVGAASKASQGLRRSPTPAERAEIDALARAEFAKNKVPADAIAKMDYLNLTALDLNSDGVPEFVGSYFVKLPNKSRGLLFVIAEGSPGKYALTHKKYEKVAVSDVMSGNIADLDQGIYSELLVDVLDVDGDGNAEVFTRTESFEGAGFDVYKKVNGKWQNSYEGSNYHSAY